MYKPFFKVFFLFFVLFTIYSCTPQIVSKEGIFSKQKIKKNIEIEKTKDATEEQKDQNTQLTKLELEKEKKNNNIKISSEIEVLLPSSENLKITNNFINSLELSIYKKNVNNLSLNINFYSDKKQLYGLIENKVQPGKIFVGPLTSKDTKDIERFCSAGVIFFSFASDRDLASECIFLINFFPEDDLRTLFEYFDSNARIALLYPENYYGYYINNIIENISINSRALIVNKASYLEDISNARDAIKQLGEYELRKYELERQKEILQNQNDEIALKALNKIKKFETIGELSFTHVIIADYNIRLLEIAPLLPFYDIDPNKIQFVGTGVWDNDVFFDEPSLQGAIFPGISKKNRAEFIEEYIKAYDSEPMRIVTIMYDLIGLLDYIIEKKLDLESAFKLLNNNKFSFEGIDGKFIFENNLIKRDLNILQIKDGAALLVE